MKATRKWAADKSFLIAIMAPQIAANCKDIAISMKDLKQRRLLGQQLPLPYLPSWFVLYRSHRKPLLYLKRLLSFSLFTEETLDTGYEIMTSMATLSKEDVPPEPPSPEDVQATLSFLNGALDQSFAEMERDHLESTPDVEMIERMAALNSEMEMEFQFFMLVVIPCMNLYAIPPTRLYWKARHGDTKSIEKLLRLDPLMLHDPLIGQQMQALKLNRKNSTYRKLLEAPLKSPKAVSPRRMKVSVAGLISAVAKGIKQPLNEPQIRALFDAIAQDSGGGLIDTDLPDSSEAFARAIRRERKFWEAMLFPDKKM